MAKAKRFKYGKQRAFDMVCVRLRDGTGRAMRGDGIHEPCVYLNDHGMKCAAGIFIPDGHPAQKMQAPWDTVLMTHPDLYTLVDPGLMDDLQYAHDRATNWTGNNYNEKGEKFLEQMAAIHRLKYTPPAKEGSK